MYHWKNNVLLGKYCNVLLEKECTYTVLLENECIIGKIMYCWENTVVYYWKKNVLLENECVIGKIMYCWEHTVMNYWKKNVLLENVLYYR